MYKCDKCHEEFNHRDEVVLLTDDDIVIPECYDGCMDAATILCCACYDDERDRRVAELKVKMLDRMQRQDNPGRNGGRYA